MNRIGGISALLLGIAYVVIVLLYAQAGPPPGAGGQAYLEYLAGRTTAWWGILALSVLTDLLFIPVGLSLYFALKDVNRNLMLLATAFIGLFVVLDLAVTWSSYAALLVLSADYTATTNEAQRAGDVAAASYASAVLASPLERFNAIVSLSVGIFLIGIVMLRAVFSKVTAYLALAIGVLGIASIAGLGLTIIASALLTTIWVFFVGYRLYRLGS